MVRNRADTGAGQDRKAIHSETVSDPGAPARSRPVEKNSQPEYGPVR